MRPVPQQRGHAATPASGAEGAAVCRVLRLSGELTPEGWVPGALTAPGEGGTGA